MKRKVGNIVIAMNVIFLAVIFLSLFFPFALLSGGHESFIRAVLDISESTYNLPPQYDASASKIASLVGLIYVPVVLFCASLWQGVKMIRLMRTGNILSYSLASCLKMSAVYLGLLGLLMPLWRFMVSFVVFLPEKHYQVSLSIGDLVLVMIGWILYMAYKSLMLGIRADIENKEFI